MPNPTKILEEIRMTVKEFLDWAETQPISYELIRGVPRPRHSPDAATPAEMMAGGTVVQGMISTNIITVLKNKLKPATSSCFPYGSDVGVSIPNEEESLVYPDITVDCGFKELEFGAKTAVKPTVVFEVLSKHTEKYDVGEKRSMYQTIETLQHIVLVAQKAPLVRVVTRTPEGWLEGWPITSLEAHFELSALKISLSLAEIYENIKFS